MSSLNFAIAPQSGTGNETLTVQPLDTNYNYRDLRATITITNGVVTRTIPVVQYGVPNFTIVSGSTTVPYTGGEVTYRITSHYRFKFVNKPSWITITAGSTTYLQDTWYEPTSNDYQILFTVAPATSSYDQTSTDFRINFDAVNDLHYDLSFILQGLPEQDYLNVVPSIYRIEWDDINTHNAFTVSSNKEWTATPDNLTDFDYLRTGAYYNVTPLNENDSSGRYLTVIDFEADGLPTVTVQAIQYHKPTMTTPSSSVVPAGGEGRTLTINSNNDWYVSGIPAFVTAAFEGTSVDLSQRQSGSNSVKNYTLTFAANPDPAQRTATITFHYYGLDGTDHTTEEVIAFTQGPQVLPVPTISIDPTSIPNTAGEVILTVNSAYNWWISTLSEPFNGEIYDYDTGERIYPQAEQQPVTNKRYRIGYSANGSYSTRRARVQFVWRENATTVHSIYTAYVEQAAKTLYSFTLNPSSGDYQWEMAAYSFEVVPDNLTAPWTATTNQSWISIIDDTEQTGTYTISFDIDDNTTGESRDGWININYVNGDSEQAVVFNITQYAEGEEPVDPVGEITLDKEAVYLGYISATHTVVQVDAAVDWYADASDGWIDLSVNSGASGVEEITISVLANNEPLGREGTVSFYNNDDVLQATLTVYQYAEYNALFDGLVTGSAFNDATNGIVAQCTTTAPVTLISNPNANLTITYLDDMGNEQPWTAGQTVNINIPPSNDVSFGRSSTTTGTTDTYVTFTIPINDSTGADSTIQFQYRFRA